MWSSTLLRRTTTNLIQGFRWNAYFRTLLYLAQFTFTRITLLSFQYLYCVRVAGERVVYFAPGVQCDTAGYRAGAAFMIVVLVAYVIGFPAAVLGLLWRNRGILHAGDEDKGTAFRTRWGILYEAFRRNPSRASKWRIGDTVATWYPSYVLLRRLVTCLLATTLVLEPRIRSFSYAISHFAFLLVHMHIRPYAGHRETASARVLMSPNHWETLSLTAIIMVASIMTAYAEPLSAAAQVITAVLLIGPSSILALCLLGSRCFSWCKARGRWGRSEQSRDLDQDRTALDHELSSFSGSALNSMHRESVMSLPRSEDGSTVPPSFGRYGLAGSSAEFVAQTGDTFVSPQSVESADGLDTADSAGLAGWSHDNSGGTSTAVTGVAAEPPVARRGPPPLPHVRGSSSDYQ